MFADQLLVRLDPAGDHLPLGSGPLLEADRAAALVIEARDLDRRHHTLGADLGNALGGKIEVLERPLHLHATHWADAELLLGQPEGLGDDDTAGNAPVVVDAAHPRGRDMALHLAVDVLEDGLDHREVGAGAVEVGGDVARGGLAGRATSSTYPNAG